MTASTIHKDHQHDVKEAILKMAFNINLTVYLVIPGDDNKVPWLSIDLTNCERTHTSEDTTV
ncbi:hypothetical protein Z517_09309 [Fonsecaea pedrosoi CBS 271.37]|uniref:Uncharacterized protein n=1 Tax=Fonsecaea pedrosoi CBS 271.37 TaxID=1442368 RepID=A0A0D2GDX9_9EURO|nr:uncharacterized protein Z517_09309 [Fonsecaea pedrosoi CBS 271.37]KIW76865.1 hypothetical protein Z517_09309 [Fonsecaea pedrosoi CBS 271.37]